MVTAPVRREVVRAMVTRGLSERRALTVVRMSASSLRYVPAPDQNASLRARIVALAHRHRRMLRQLDCGKARLEFDSAERNRSVPGIAFTQTNQTLIPGFVEIKKPARGGRLFRSEADWLTDPRADWDSH